MDFSIPEDIQQKLKVLDEFIEREIKPLEAENMQYFDHRREYARTDWENDGVPQKAWEDLLGEMRRLAARCSRIIAMPRFVPSEPPSSLGST